ncbi:MAG: trypsin-like serine protease, partial [Planctomycetota bacterium]
MSWRSGAGWRGWVVRLGVVAALLPVCPAMGLSIQDDVNQSAHEVLADIPPFNLSGTFTNSGGGRSGTLLNDEWVLTAAHNGNRAGFTLNGQTSSIAERIVFPGDPNGNNASDGLDFALMRLSTPITPPSAFPGFYTGDHASLFGDLAYLTGSGDTGTGVDPGGATGPSARLAGTNRVSQVGGTVLGTEYADNIVFTDFSDPDESAFPSVTSAEVGLTNGDSGGGFWLQDDEGDYVLAGVHSFVFPVASQQLGLYGQINASTLLTQDVIAWIEQTISGVLEGDYNGDGVVDGADYTFWANRFGGTTADDLLADGNGDGVVDGADY